MSITTLQRILPQALVACLVVVAVLSLLLGPPAWAQGERPPPPPPPTHVDPPITSVSDLAAQGYQIAGPSVVKDYSGRVLSLDSGRKGLVFNLKGKDLTVLSHDNVIMTESAIVQGARVLLGIKGPKAVVFVSPNPSATGGPTNDPH